MKKAIKAIVALLCVLATVISASACSLSTGGNRDGREETVSQEIGDGKIDNEEAGISESDDKEIIEKESSDDENSKDERTATREPIGEYVYFGSYPQREVVAQASDSGVCGKDWETENDCITDAGLYNALKSLSEDSWNANGDATLNGNKYRRIKADDATYRTSGDSNYYDWSSSDEYHYFKYEPIRWKVLEQNGSDILLLSETVLDDQKYNTKITNVTWETCTVRSWLNGYGSDNNLYGTDYTGNNFIDTAFTSEEQAKIKITALKNGDNSNSDTEGGNDTEDKIFLLSEDEVYGTRAAGFGFADDYKTHDEARRAESSTYAKAMGTYADCEEGSLGSCWWWLRSPGSYTGLFALVRCNGSVYRGGQHADSKSRGIRPALYITVESDQSR